MRKLLLFFFITCPVILTFSQDFSTYYHQRKTLFERLPDTPGEIIFLGNSITDGCNWGELFNDVNIKNRGISGDVSAGILYRLDEVVSSGPDMIFLMIGINDLAREIPVDSIVRSYGEILQRIRKASPSTEVFVQSVLPVNPEVGDRFLTHKSKLEEIRLLNERLKDMASRFSMTYIDLHKEMRNKQGYLERAFTNDGLHLTGSGYLKWKQVIEPYFQ